MTKIAMTTAQIRAAGYIVEAYYPTSANAETRKSPWIIRHIKRGNVLRRYRTRAEAVADLHSEMTDPDGVLRQDH